MFKEKRANIPSWYRLEIASEQSWKCNNCMIQLPGYFDIDHKIALCNGGTNDRGNLQALCVSCHAKKSRSERFSIPEKPPIVTTSPIRETSSAIVLCKCLNCDFVGDSRFIYFHKCKPVDVNTMSVGFGGMNLK